MAEQLRAEPHTLVGENVVATILDYARSRNVTKIFEKFFRAASVTADARRGVGLGLTICLAIMHAHQGTISAHNRAGGGAEFRLALPLGNAPPPVPAELEHSTLETAP